MAIERSLQTINTVGAGKRCANPATPLPDTVSGMDIGNSTERTAYECEEKKKPFKS